MAGSLQRSQSFCQASVHLHQLISVLVFAVWGCRCKWMFRAGPGAPLLQALLESSEIKVVTPLSHLSFSQLKQRQSGNKELQALC